MDFLDPRISYGIFRITTQLGGEYFVTARRSSGVDVSCDLLDFSAKGAEITVLRQDGIIRTGCRLTFTSPNGEIHSPNAQVFSVAQVGLRELWIDRSEGLFTVKTEDNGEFTVLTEREHYGRALIQCPKYYPEETFCYLGDNKDCMGRIGVGSLLFVVRHDSGNLPLRERNRQFSRVLTICPS